MPIQSCFSFSRVRHALVLCTLFMLGGCSIFRPAKFMPPAGYETDARLTPLRNAATRTAGYAALFPAPPKLFFAGEITARGRWWSGGLNFSTYYFAYRPGQGEPALRFRGFTDQPSVTLFDIMVREGNMTVMMPTEHQGFQGKIPPNGSAFRERFGVEPWQLSDIFMLGRTLGTGSFQATEDGRRIELVPAGKPQPGAPQAIDLDAASGLPMRAEWNANGQQYTVNYLAWDWFKSQHTETENLAPAQLMPKRLIIRRASPRASLEVEIERYDFGVEISPDIFNMLTDDPIKLRPLGELGEALR